MDILAMPKVELHQHLELSVRDSTVKEIAPTVGVELANEAAFRDHFIQDAPSTNLGAVLNKFLNLQKIWCSTELFERITYEVIEDAHKLGVKILELRYAPTWLKQGQPHMSFEEIHQAIHKGVRRAEADFPIAVGLICIIQRILEPREAEQVVDFAIENRASFIGLDLADNEEGFDSKPFAPFFARAKEAGLGITVHSGEINTEKSPRYPKDAIEYLGAQRIGHGVNIYRDPAMIEYVIEKDVTLELCVTSNYLTQGVPGELKDHPFRQLMEAGVPVTINTDDPTFFDTDIEREYKILADLHGLTEEDFRRCNERAAQASFIDPVKKKKFWPSL